MLRYPSSRHCDLGCILPFMGISFEVNSGTSRPHGRNSALKVDIHVREQTESSSPKSELSAEDSSISSIIACGKLQTIADFGYIKRL